LVADALKKVFMIFFSFATQTSVISHESTEFIYLLLLHLYLLTKQKIGACIKFRASLDPEPTTPNTKSKIHVSKASTSPASVPPPPTPPTLPPTSPTSK
jgi:hypothetical protein